MTTPFLSSLVAISYFGWLWHDRGAVEGRRFLASVDIPKRAKLKQRTLKRLHLRAGSSTSTVREMDSRPKVTTAFERPWPENETNLVSFSRLQSLAQRMNVNSGQQEP